MKTLIIEDDQDIIDSISLAFRLYWPETEVIYANLGAAGIEMVRTEAPETVVLDLGLPDITGFEVLKQIRLFSSVPVIILTVRSQEEDVVRALEGEATDYLTKPFRQKELIARIQAHSTQWMTNEIRKSVKNMENPVS
ncbi:MAG: response regulator [Dehalococcoidales bacterium]|nr:response regulator [Dehalococcoidales bacterium]